MNWEARVIQGLFAARTTVVRPKSQQEAGKDPKLGLTRPNLLHSWFKRMFWSTDDFRGGRQVVFSTFFAS